MNIFEIIIIVMSTKWSDYRGIQADINPNTTDVGFHLDYRGIEADINPNTTDVDFHLDYRGIHADINPNTTEVGFYLDIHVILFFPDN